MRDIGILVWVVLLLVGVIGSMISSVRRQMQQASPPARRPPPQRTFPQAPQSPPAHAPPPPVQKQAVAERQMVRRVAVEQPHGALPDYPLSAPRVTHGSKAMRRLFSSREGLIGAVIAAEVIGKPVALREYPTY